MTSLSELQRRFQQHVLAADAAIEANVNASSQVSAVARLAIYSEAYRLRLTEALASNFPRLQQLLRDEAFASVAQGYIAAHTSNFRSIRWFGALLPASLELSHAQQPWLAELAQWEWAIATAFDARDATPIAGEALAATPPEHWPGLKFEFHPSVQRVIVSTNAPALFKALGEEQPPPPPESLECEQSWLIWRQDLKTSYRSLTNLEAEVLHVLMNGGNFETMCDVLCASCEAEEIPLRAASFLKTWVSEGLVVGVRRELGGSH